MSWLVARLREGNTWAGFGATLAAVSAAFPAAAVYAGGAAAVCGTIAGVLKEGKPAV